MDNTFTKYEIIGKAKLYQIDCMELLSQYPDKHFDLAIVDPPYGIGVSGINIIPNRNDKPVYYSGWDKKAPDAVYFEELIRVSKEQIIWGGELLFESSWIL